MVTNVHVHVTHILPKMYNISITLETSLMSLPSCLLLPLLYHPLWRQPLSWSLSPQISFTCCKHHIKGIIRHALLSLSSFTQYHVFKTYTFCTLISSSFLFLLLRNLTLWILKLVKGKFLKVILNPVRCLSLPASRQVAVSQWAVLFSWWVWGCTWLAHWQTPSICQSNDNILKIQLLGIEWASHSQCVFL